MERFDIYDSNGIVTGRTAVKGTPCTGEDYYLGIHVYLYNSQHQFLLQRRAKTKQFKPDAWELLLEHSIAGETSLETAVRGVREEYGLSIEAPHFQFYKRIFWEEFHHIIDIYFLKADLALSEITLQQEEVSAVEWIEKKEMEQFVDKMAEYRPQDYLDSIKAYLRDL